MSDVVSELKISVLGLDRGTTTGSGHIDFGLRTDRPYEGSGRRRDLRRGTAPSVLALETRREGMTRTGVRMSTTRGAATTRVGVDKMRSFGPFLEASTYQEARVHGRPRLPSQAAEKLRHPYRTKTSDAPSLNLTTFLVASACFGAETKRPRVEILGNFPLEKLFFGNLEAPDPRLRKRGELRNAQGREGVVRSASSAMPRPETFTFSSCLADDDEYDTKVTYISSRSDESNDECDAWVNGFYESSDKGWGGHPRRREKAEA